MSKRRFAGLVSIAVAAATWSACTPDAVCGDGVVQAGETEATCCPDTGCAFGACVGVASDAPPQCQPPWTQESCAEGACSATEPYRCNAFGVPPTWDPHDCDCPDGSIPSSIGACVDAATVPLERSASVVPSDLPLDEYTRLYTDLAALGQHAAREPLASLAARWGEAMRADPRVNVLVIGAADGSDAADVRDAIVAGLALPAGATTAPARTDVTRTSDECSALAAAAGAAILPDAFVIATVNDDLASRATCTYIGTYPSCVVPSADDCVLVASRFSVTAIVVDFRSALPQLDQAMLSRATYETRADTGQFLDDALLHWNAAASILPTDDGLVVAGRTTAAFDLVDPLTAFVVVGDPTVKPLRLASFRAVWADPPSQDFLVAHDILSVDCTFGAAGADVTMHCENNGFALDAVVSATNFTLVDVTTAP